MGLKVVVCLFGHVFLTVAVWIGERPETRFKASMTNSRLHYDCFTQDKKQYSEYRYKVEHPWSSVYGKDLKLKINSDPNNGLMMPPWVYSLF